MKLEIKHLASYLEHKVVLSYTDCLTKRKRNAFLSGISNKEIETTYLRKIKGCSGDYISWDGNNNVHDLQVKPILFPLSSLTKEINFNGETFVPIYKIYEFEQWDTDELYEIINNGTIEGIYNDLNLIPYSHAEKLFEWKIDVFGLIDAGLAEPVTEDFNPYK